MRIWFLDDDPPSPATASAIREGAKKRGARVLVARAPVYRSEFPALAGDFRCVEWDFGNGSAPAACICASRFVAAARGRPGAPVAYPVLPMAPAAPRAARLRVGVAGGGESPALRSALEQARQIKSVEFVGGEDRMDVAIGTDWTGGFDFALARAQAAGAVAVGFDVGSHPEITPFIFANAHDALEQIRAFGDDPELFERCRAASRRWARRFADGRSWRAALLSENVFAAMLRPALERAARAAYLWRAHGPKLFALKLAGFVARKTTR